MDQATLISRYAEYYGTKTAIVFGEKRWSFQEVNERANALAHGLMGLGVKKAERVASLLRNCPQHIEILFAKFKMGAVDVGLNSRLAPEELVWQLNDCEARALFVGEDQWRKISSVRDQIPTLKDVILLHGRQTDTIPYEEFINGQSKKDLHVELEGEKPGRIFYTGGTTGQAKGIVVTWQSDLSVTRNLLLDMIPDLHSADVFLGLQPLYHATGTFILPCWLRGAAHVVVEDFDPARAFWAIEKERVTIIKTVPTVLVRLMASPEIKQRDFRSVRTLIYGASPMPVEKLKEAIQIFGPIFIQNYGQSEAPMTICLLKKEDHVIEGSPERVARLASIGRPYTMVRVKVADEEGKEVPPGELGEILVQGDHMMLGYWKNPEATQETLKDGWIYTRDIGRMDEKGYIFLVDRKSEMIISGGLNVYPQEVEQVLYQHPAVMEATVFGVPDEKWGESIKAAVVLKAGTRATAEELIEFCKARLASYKKPTSVDILAELPKSDTGKILRRSLRDHYWRGHQRKIH